MEINQQRNDFHNKKAGSTIFHADVDDETFAVAIEEPRKKKKVKKTKKVSKLFEDNYEDRLFE
jgi:hypothetical protein